MEYLFICTYKGMTYRLVTLNYIEGHVNQS